MICPYCTADDCGVTDSRQSHGYIRRRRQCPSCRERFSTIELVIDDERQLIQVPLFERQKSGNVRRIDPPAIAPVEGVEP